jgi:hypothetical protein
MKLVGFTYRKMLLIVLCLISSDRGIRTYLDFSLQIIGLLMEGSLYMQVERPEIAAIVEPDEVARPLVMLSAIIRFCLRDVMRSFMCKVKIVQVHRYSVKIIVRFQFGWERK